MFLSCNDKVVSHSAKDDKELISFLRKIDPELSNKLLLKTEEVLKTKPDSKLDQLSLLVDKNLEYLIAVTNVIQKVL